jgi:hypothetical protein
MHTFEVPRVSFDWRLDMSKTGIISVMAHKNCDGINTIWIKCEDGFQLCMPLDEFQQLFGRYHMPTLGENFYDYVCIAIAHRITFMGE